MDILFSSAQYDRVKAATSHLLSDADYSANLEIADYINKHPHESKDYAKALKKRLKSDKHDGIVQYLTLCLIETLVKNTAQFIQQCAQPDLLSTVIDVATGKLAGHASNAIPSPASRNSMGSDTSPSGKKTYITEEQEQTQLKAANKARSLLQEWALYFGRQGTNTFPIFSDTYSRLKQQGVAFSAEPSDQSAQSHVYGRTASTPSASATPASRSTNTAQKAYNDGSYEQRLRRVSSGGDATSPSARSTGSGGAGGAAATSPLPVVNKEAKEEWKQWTSVTDEYKEKVRKDCNIVMNYLNLLKDMLVASVEDNSDVQKNDAITSLVVIVRQIKKRMSHIIASVDDEYLLNLTIEMHTQIHEVLSYYELRLKGDTTATVPDLHDIMDPTEKDKKLVAGDQRGAIPIDLSVFNQASTQPPGGSSSSSSSSQAVVDRSKPPKHDQQARVHSELYGAGTDGQPEVNPFTAFDNENDFPSFSSSQHPEDNPLANNPLSNNPSPAPPQTIPSYASASAAVDGKRGHARGYSGNVFEDETERKHEAKVNEEAARSSFDNLSLDFDQHGKQPSATGTRGGFDEIDGWQQFGTTSNAATLTSSSK